MNGGVVVLTPEQLQEVIANAVTQAVALLRDNEPDRWLTTAKAADYLDVHADTLKRAAARGELPTEQNGDGGRLYFRQSALDAWRRGERS